MPPPNHQPASPSRAKKRTLRCTVGQYGIARMQHERYAHRLPGCARELRPRRGRRRRQLAALHVGEVHAAALEQLAVLRSCAWFRRRLPRAASRRLLKAWPSAASKRGDDRLLQRDEVVADGFGLHCRQRWTPLDRAVADVACGTACRRSGCARPPRTRACCAIFTESPSAVTHSTRPPLVTSALPSARGAGVEHAAIVRGRRASR